MKSRWNWKCICTCTALLATVALLSLPVYAPPPGGNNGPGGGQLSPASLDLDTCGCPTTFDQPTCEKRTSWTLDKTTDTGPLINPDGEFFLFDVTVTEGPTTKILSGSGQIVITNSGEQTPSLASVAVLLEDRTVGVGDAPGPSGKDWTVLRVVAESEAADCGDSAVICDGHGNNAERVLVQSLGSNLVLFNCDDMNDIIALSNSVEIPPTLDNDGDGLRDEDPPLPSDPDDVTGGCAVIDNDGDGSFDEDPIDGIDNDGDGLIDEDDPDDDGDGLVDEDGACEDAVIFCFEFEFDITGLGIEGPGDGVVPSDDDLRIDLLVTFKAGGKRGGTCSADVDCDGVLEDGKFGNPDEGEGHVRTIQQRLRFDPVGCDPVCESVTLTDLGAFSLDESCAVVDSTDTLDEQIGATGVEGTQTVRQITGTVTCACDPAVHGGGGGGSTPVTDFTTDPVDTTGSDLSGVVQGVLSVGLSQGDGGFCGGSPNFVCRDDPTDDINCSRVFIDDDGDPTFSLFRMMTFDLGSPKRGFRMFTAIDHWDGNPQSFVDGCCGSSADFVTQDVMEYSVWGTNVDPTADDDNNGVLDIRQMSSWKLLSDVVAFDNSQATIDANGHPTFTFDGDDGAAAAAPVRVYINGSALCGAASFGGHGYSRDYVFCDAHRFVGVRASSISIAANDSDPEVDGVFGYDPEESCAAECQCETTITNTAELTCEEDQSLVEGSPASASFDVECAGDGDGIEVGDFCTQTQGGWGQDSCSGPAGSGLPDCEVGGNVACFRDCNFDDLFDDLIVGDPDGPDADSSFAILLSSSGAVADYLPAGGTPAALTADLTDPETTSSGVFGAQLVAATLNVAVDDAGLRRDGGAQPFPAGTLGTLIYVDCVDNDLLGLSVNDVLALANVALSGGSTPTGVTISDLSDAMAALNENFVDCDTNIGCLALP